MLILGRKPEQVVNLYTSDGLIKVVIHSVDPDTGYVRLGFEAPESVDILREEIDNFVIDPA